MNIYILSNREVVNQNDIAGINGENNAEIMQFHFPEKIVGIDMSKITKWIQFKNDEVENKLDLLQMIENDQYSLTNLITQYESVEYQVLLMYEELVLWKSKIAELNFDESLDVDVTITLDDLSVLNQLRLQVEELKTQYEEAIKQGNTDITKLKTEIDELEKSISSAENLRVIAENERVAAEQERNQKFTDLVEEVNNAISKLKHSIAEYNENAEEKIGQLNSVASSAVSSVNSEKSSALSSISSAKNTAIENIETKEASSITAIDNETTNKIKEIDDNTADKVEEFNTNATNKTDTFNTNAGTKTTDFNNNAIEKTDTFNENFEQKLEEFNSDANVERITSLEEENAYQNKLITGLLENQDKETTTEETITDAMIGPVNIVPRGRVLKQETRQGYNLLDFNNLMMTLINPDKLVQNPDNSITVNNVLDTEYPNGFDIRKNYDDDNPLVLKAGTYTFDFGINGYEMFNCEINIKSLGKGEYLGIKYLAGNFSKKSFTFNEDFVIYNYNLHFKPNTAFNNFTIYPMIYEGTEEKLYEAFGQSPSMDYPSPIEYVEGNQKIEHVNKNLLRIYDGTVSVQGISFSKKDGAILITGTGTAEYPTFSQVLNLRKGKYIFNGETGQPENAKTGKYIRIYNDNSSNYVNYTSDFEITGNEYRVLFIIVARNGITYNEVYTPQIELGNTATEYTPHQSETYQLTNLPPMYSENDYIYKKDGKWFVYNELKKDKLTSNLNWSISASNFWYFYFDNTLSKKAPNQNRLFSNYFQKSNTWGYEQGASYVVCGNGSNGLIGISKATFDTIEDLKTFLDENDVYIIAELETPTETEITDTTLIEQLEKLQKIFTYQGVNHFIVTSENGHPVMLEITYYKDTIQIMQKQINKLEQAILSLGGNV